MNFQELIKNPRLIAAKQEMFCTDGELFEFRLVRMTLFPRITILNRWDIKAQRTTLTWQVDGIDYPDQTSALTYLLESGG